MFPNQLFPAELFPVKLFSRFKPSLEPSLSNSISISQTVTCNLVYNISLSQSITLTQSVTKFNSYTLTSNLSVTDSVSYNARHLKSLISNVALTDSVSYIHTGTFDQYILNTLSLNADITFIQVFEGAHTPPQHTANITNTLSLVQTLSKTVIYSRSLSNNLVFTQDAVLSNQPHLISNILLTDSISSNVNYVLSVTNTLILIQSQLSSHFKYQSLTSNLVLSQTATVLKQKSRRLQDDLTLTQTVTFDKFLHFNINDTLNFTDQVNLNTKLTQNISHNLLFKGGGGYGSDSPSGNKIIDGHSTYYYPDALPVKVHRYVVLTGITSIILPAPLFGDTRSNVAAINTIRMVNGGIYNYIKTTNRQKLNYKFELKRQKAFELQQFIDDNDLTWLTMINFKGEQWAVRIINNPITFEATGRGYVCPNNAEVHQVTLELHGVLISGSASSC